MLERIKRDPFIIRVGCDEPPGRKFADKLISLILIASECRVDSILITPAGNVSDFEDDVIRNIIDRNRIIEMANDSEEPIRDERGNYVICRDGGIVCLRDCSDGNKYSISVAANMDNVVFVPKIAALISNIMGFSGVLSFGVRFSIYELLDNIVEYGVNDVDRARVEIGLRGEGDKLAVSITDEGIEFDSTSGKEFDLESYLRSGGKRGLGLMMIKKMNKGMQYARDKGYNRIVIEKDVLCEEPSWKENAMSSFKADISQAGEGGACRVDLKGDLDSKGALSLEKLMNDLLDKKIRYAILDFEDVTFVSSAGVGMLLGLVSSLRRDNGRVIFINVSQKVKSVFGLLNLNDYFEFSSPDELVNR